MLHKTSSTSSSHIKMDLPLRPVLSVLCNTFLTTILLFIFDMRPAQPILSLLISKSSLESRYNCTNSQFLLLLRYPLSIMALLIFLNISLSLLYSRLSFPTVKTHDSENRSSFRCCLTSRFWFKYLLHYIVNLIFCSFFLPSLLIRNFHL